VYASKQESLANAKVLLCFSFWLRVLD